MVMVTTEEGHSSLTVNPKGRILDMMASCSGLGAEESMARAGGAAPGPATYAALLRLMSAWTRASNEGSRRFHNQIEGPY